VCQGRCPGPRARPVYPGADVRGKTSELTRGRPAVRRLSVRPGGAPLAPSDQRQARAAIGEALVDELWARTRIALPGFMGLMLIAWPVVRAAVTTDPVARDVYVATLAIAVARLVLTHVILRRPTAVTAAWRYRLMLGGAAASGVSLGALDVLFFQQLSPINLAVWTMFVAGMAAASVISMGARPEVFLAYAGPALGVIALVSLVWPREGLGVVGAACALWLPYGLLQAIDYRKSRVAFLSLNAALDSNVSELRAKNRELEEMGQRADRIFTALAEALPGKTLGGKYLLEERIGAGGFAVVFRATHVGVERPVAVKVFRPQAGNDTAEALERFRYEGRTGGMLRHPNVVDVLDAGLTEDGIAYIAMELLQGRALDAELGEPMAIARVTTILAQACRGLAAAHAAGIIHRDVKPANIFLQRQGDAEIVKLLDFGIAKVTTRVRATDDQLTQTGALMGTPVYMAPERLLGEESDASADVYSIGVVLYRALSGKLPYEGSLGEIMVKAVSGAPPHLREVAPAVPHDLATIVMRALAHEPSDRPTAAELADELTACLGRLAGVFSAQIPNS